MPGSYNSNAPSTHIKSPLWQTHLRRIGRFKHRTAIAASSDYSQGKVSFHNATSILCEQVGSQMGHVGNLIEEKKLYITENITLGTEMWIWEPFSREGFTALCL